MMLLKDYTIFHFLLDTLCIAIITQKVPLFRKLIKFEEQLYLSKVHSKILTLSFSSLHLYTAYRVQALMWGSVRIDRKGWLCWCYYIVALLGNDSAQQYKNDDLGVYFVFFWKIKICDPPIFMLKRSLAMMWCDLRKPVTWCKIDILSYNWYHVKVWIILFPELLLGSPLILVSKGADVQRP